MDAGPRAGALFFALLALISGMFAIFAPMWLITRTEMSGHYCWKGEGIFYTNYQWGDYELEKINRYCPTTPLAGLDSSYRTYCQNDGNSDFNVALCHATNLAKKCSIVFLSSAVLLILLICRWILHGSQQSLGFCFILSLSILQSLAAICICFIMFNSPIFTQEHYEYLSRDFIRKYDGIGCVFQTPLGSKNILGLFRSSPLECVFAGPAFGMGLLSAVTSIFSTCFLVYDTLKACRTRAAENQLEESLLRNMSEKSQKNSFQSLFFALSGRKQREISPLFLPLLCVLNIAIFAFANSSPATTVSVNMNVAIERQALALDSSDLNSVRAREVLQIEEDVFDFTLITSIIYFFKGEAYLLGSLTAVFGLAWPYAKLGSWLILTFFPFSEAIRGNLLLWLDLTGKYSLINGIVLCLMIVAFYLNSKTMIKPWIAPNIIRKGDALDADITVNTSVGIGTFWYIVGCVMSQFIGSLFLSTHAGVAEWSKAENEYRTLSNSLIASETTSMDVDVLNFCRFLCAENRRKLYANEKFVSSERLTEHNFRKTRGYFRYTSTAMMLFLAFVCLEIFIIVYGASTASFQFSFGGLVGAYLVPRDQKERSYTLLSCGKELYKLGGGVVLIAVYHLYCIIIPLIEMLMICYVWTGSFTLDELKRLYKILCDIESNSGLDVFVISLLSILLEISKLSEALLGSSFTELSKVADKAFPDQGGLFEVQPKILKGAWFLLAGAVLEKVITFFSLRHCQRSIEDREKLENELMAHLYNYPESPREFEEFLQRKVEFSDETIHPGIFLTTAE